MSEPAIHELTYIVCCIGSTYYAIPSSDVQQLEMLEDVTPVPNSPDFLDGVVYLRGQVVPVVNLRRRFGLERVPYDLSSRLIVVKFDARVVGLAVDSAREFLKFASDDLQPAPQSFGPPENDPLAGVLKRDERMILVLEVRRLLAPGILPEMSKS